MPPLSELAPIWAAFAIACLTPGANSIAVAETALADGRRQGVLVAAGVAIGAVGWALAAAFGLHSLIERVPRALQVLAWLGGGWFLWLSMRALRGVLRPAAFTVNRSSGASTREKGVAVIRGLLTSWSNPKVALVWLGLSTALAGHATQPATIALFAAGIALLAMAIYGGFALLLAGPAGRTWYARHLRWFNGLFAVYFAAFAASLLWRFG